MDVTDLLASLVEIDSSTADGANQAVDFCSGWLKGREIDSVKFEAEGACMIVAETGQGKKTIVLNGHVDVVPGEPEQFDPYIRDGKMFGRGTADMKAGVAAMMGVMAELQKRDLPDCKVQLQIVSDEETGSHCSKYLADHGYRGNFVICGEPTQLGIGLQSKGVLYLDIEVPGKPAHGSRPWEGENAILKAFHLYEKITELPFAEESTDMYPFPSIDLPIIKGGAVMNQVPDSCLMSLDIRYLPGQAPEEIVRQIERVTDGKVTVTETGDPIATKADDPYVRALEAACKSANHGEPAPVFGQHGSSDGKHFAKYGVPAVEFGPAGGDWHGEKEYVDLASIDRYMTALLNLIDGIRAK